VKQRGIPAIRRQALDVDNGESHSGARMKNLMLAAVSAVAVLGFHPVTSASGVDVGVSVQISQPGVYGRIDIGNFPQPQVWVPQPVIVARPTVVVPGPPVQPVYMWVPPGHRKDWSKHCSRYNACGVPVYFVRDDWYESNVYPAGKGGKGHKEGKGGGNGQGNGKGHNK
jgi:hypothetical protein